MNSPDIGATRVDIDDQPTRPATHCATKIEEYRWRLDDAPTLTNQDTQSVGLQNVLHTRYISVIARRPLSDPDTRLAQLTLYEVEERPLWIRDAAGTVR